MNTTHERAQWAVVQEALERLTTDYWLDWAAKFEGAIIDPGDLPGLCDAQQIQRNNDQLHERAELCRWLASRCQFDQFEEVVAVVLEGVA